MPSLGNLLRPSPTQRVSKHQASKRGYIHTKGKKGNTWKAVTRTRRALGARYRPTV